MKLLVIWFMAILFLVALDITSSQYSFPGFQTRKDDDYKPDEKKRDGMGTYMFSLVMFGKETIIINTSKVDNYYAFNL